MKNFLILLCVVSLYSCSSINYHYASETLTQPTNINPLKGKWLIDKPTLNQLDLYYEEIIIAGYKKNFSKKTEKFDYIFDFKNIFTLNETKDKSSKVLDLYKSQLDYDYLISTNISLMKNEKPTIPILPERGISRELKTNVIVYDLNLKKIIFEKEYITKEVVYAQFGVINIIDTKLEKFVEWTVKKVTSDLQKEHNWNLIF
jgi:hypothetical protein